MATQNNAGPAASGSANRDGTDNMIEQLTLPAEVADNVAGIENYNPWSPSSTSKTYFYEPLMIRSSMNCQVVPWLATGYKWEGPTKLSFTIRDGVKWSDGQPLTAEDVAFTLNMKKQYPALDDIGLWSDTFGGSAKSVIVDGNKVVIDFTGNAAAKFDSLITARIVPQHVWSSVGDPTKYVDTKPGTASVGGEAHDPRVRVEDAEDERDDGDEGEPLEYVAETAPDGGEDLVVHAGRVAGERDGGDQRDREADRDAGDAG